MSVSGCPVCKLVFEVSHALPEREDLSLHLGSLPLLARLQPAKASIKLMEKLRPTIVLSVGGRGGRWRLYLSSRSRLGARRYLLRLRKSTLKGAPSLTLVVQFCIQVARLRLGHVKLRPQFLGEAVLILRNGRWALSTRRSRWPRWRLLHSDLDPTAMMCLQWRVRCSQLLQLCSKRL